MDFKTDGKEKKLNFGVRFVAELDDSEKYDAEGISFGIGLMLAQQKLGMGNLGTLATVIKHALHGESITVDEVFDALDGYAEADELEVLFAKVEEELKNSKAVRIAQARAKKASIEAKRKQAATLTKK